MQAAESMHGTSDCRKMFNFNNHKDGWKLPIIDIKEKILDLVGGNQLVVLSGSTRCGKSTQVPQYILGKNAMDWNLGELVG